VVSTGSGGVWGWGRPWDRLKVRVPRWIGTVRWPCAVGVAAEEERMMATPTAFGTERVCAAREECETA